MKLVKDNETFSTTVLSQNSLLTMIVIGPQKSVVLPQCTEIFDLSSRLPVSLADPSKTWIIFCGSKMGQSLILLSCMHYFKVNIRGDCSGMRLRYFAEWNLTELDGINTWQYDTNWCRSTLTSPHHQFLHLIHQTLNANISLSHLVEMNGFNT